MATSKKERIYVDCHGQYGEMKPVLSNKQPSVLVYLLVSINFPSKCRHLLIKYCHHLLPYGVIQYSVIAGIVRSKDTKLEHTTTKPIISVKEIVNANVPRLMEPASNRAVRRMQTPKHDDGSIFLSVKIDCHGYCPGESVSINVKVENQSTTQVNAIHASLVQKANYIVTLFEPGGYYGRNYVKRGYHKYRKSSLRIIQKIESSGIPPGKIGHWNNELFPIPAVPPTTVGDRMIMLSYVLDVSAAIHKAGSLTLQFPVTIATTPFGQPSGPSTE